jgi:hypothetical protein
MREGSAAAPGGAVTGLAAFLRARLDETGAGIALAWPGAETLRAAQSVPPEFGWHLPGFALLARNAVREILDAWEEADDATRPGLELAVRIHAWAFRDHPDHPD